MSLKTIIHRIMDTSRGVLSDRTILKYNRKGLLIEGNLSPSQIQPNSIDLTLGKTWKKPKANSRKFGCKCIDPIKPIEYKEGVFNKSTESSLSVNDYYVLMPGEFILMASNEVLNIPNGILSFVQGRSSIARLAIQTEQAGLIDAGFRGTITFEVHNQSDKAIVLYAGMRVAQVYFFKAQYANKPYGSNGKGSKYQSQIEATGSRINLDPELKDSIKVKFDK